LAFGPIVGGLITQYLSWNWVFLINLPIGVGAFLVTSAVVRESHDTSGTVATDIPGTVLVTLAIGSLTYGLIEAGQRGWNDSLILTAFAVSAVMFAAFVYVESRTARPMVPLRFFRSSTFTGANIVALAISFLISGVAFSMTLYQQNVHGYSPVRAGLTLLPLVITMMVCSPISGALINRIGPSKLLALGMIITGSSALLFLRTGAHASFLDIVPALVVMGLGNSLIFAPMTTAVLNSVETEKSGVASAVNGAVRETGFAFGIALLGTIMNRVYQDRYDSSSEIQALREAGNPAAVGVADFVGSGLNWAGRMVEDPGNFTGDLGPLGQLVAQLQNSEVAAIREASSVAFVAGMDRSFILTSVVIMLFAVLSYFLIHDDVATAKPLPEPDADEAEALFRAQAAD
jgi:EmrB/QacA subfamily drug resistance transporter